LARTPCKPGPLTQNKRGDRTRNKKVQNHDQHGWIRNSFDAKRGSLHQQSGWRHHLGERGTSEQCTRVRVLEGENNGICQVSKGQKQQVFCLVWGKREPELGERSTRSPKTQDNSGRVRGGPLNEVTKKERGRICRGRQRTRKGPQRVLPKRKKTWGREKTRGALNRSANAKRG